MLKNIIHFLKYNNLTTLLVSAALVGSGGAFAASPELRAAAEDAFVGRTETVVAIDNAAILNADLTAFDPALVITAVSEDADRYLVSYRFNTFDVMGGAWQRVERTGELKIAKNALGDSDLRAYVEKELGEVARQEIRYLKEAQLAERKKGVTKQVVAVSYAGLLGLVIDPEVKTVEPKPIERLVDSLSDVARPTNEETIKPADLDVKRPSEEIIPTEEATVSSTPSATQSATTTDPAILIAPVEPPIATTTEPINTSATTTSIEN